MNSGISSLLSNSVLRKAIFDRGYFRQCSCQTISLFRLRRYSSRASATRYYDVLGITPSATHSQIKDSFYRLSKIYHPDVNKSDSAQVTFQELSQAYEVLGNKRNRKLYDRGLLNPTDLRSHHQASSNVEDATEETFSSKGAFSFKRKDPIPTGRSRVYNFDEFYQQHYGEALKRAASARENNTSEDLHRLTESTKRIHKWHVLCVCIIGLVVLTYPAFESRGKAEEIKKTP